MQCNDVDNANRVFSAVVDKSNFTYSAMFKGMERIYLWSVCYFHFSHYVGYLLNKMPEKVLDLYDTMLVEPNAHCLSLIFRACGQVNNERAKKIGGELLRQMPKESRKDIVLLNSVLSMLMNFGKIQAAEKVFTSMKRMDVVSYATMIKGDHSGFILYLIDWM